MKERKPMFLLELDYYVMVQNCAKDGKWKETGLRNEYPRHETLQRRKELPAALTVFPSYLL
jgi:hypothetical protein